MARTSCVPSSAATDRKAVEAAVPKRTARAMVNMNMILEGMVVMWPGNTFRERASKRAERGKIVPISAPSRVVLRG